ncbi:MULTISPECIES: hypothetical protein [Bacillus cereus group]|uniref:Uncharacterized protein n=1 Tax=Bacillus cereus HuA3-9 TaxID=1053205 RepID=R8DG16_BACCE|nr:MULTISPECIES: hypothetical protein [Bacillus cereus group]EOO22781.1 hypothetical protein IGA_00229 [Bacillus cereus HuA3-9]
MGKEVKLGNKLKISSDWGKLELAGEDIYKFKAGKPPLNKQVKVHLVWEKDLLHFLIRQRKM